jgi:mono/diheme cytochrome c family protein
MATSWPKMIRAANALTLSMLLTAIPVTSYGQSDHDTILGTAQLDDPKRIEAGRRRFNQACTYCHGKEGEGGKTPSFKGRKDLDAQTVFNVISNGRRRGANIMPPWKNSLSEEQIQELVAYILSLGSTPGSN